MTSPFVRALILVLILGVSAGGFYPSDASADESSRISQLELEIQRLRSRIDEQHRRILALEDELNRRRNTGLIETLPDKRVERVGSGSPPATDPQPWHAPEAWAQIAKGMTEAEVTEILGPATAIESVESYKTLFYRGSVAGRGALSGIVNMRDERVVAVNQPDF
jgi:hypothetical protein